MHRRRRRQHCPSPSSLLNNLIFDTLSSLLLFISSGWELLRLLLLLPLFNLHFLFHSSSLTFHLELNISSAFSLPFYPVCISLSLNEMKRRRKRRQTKIREKLFRVMQTRLFAFYYDFYYSIYFNSLLNVSFCIVRGHEIMIFEKFPFLIFLKIG